VTLVFTTNLLLLSPLSQLLPHSTGVILLALVSAIFKLGCINQFTKEVTVHPNTIIPSPTENKN